MVQTFHKPPYFLFLTRLTATIFSQKTSTAKEHGRFFHQAECTLMSATTVPIIGRCNAKESVKIWNQETAGEFQIQKQKLHFICIKQYININSWENLLSLVEQKNKETKCVRKIWPNYEGTTQKEYRI